MLSVQENEVLTRIDRGSPMGDYVRRFWVPFLMSTDVGRSSALPRAQPAVRVSLTHPAVPCFCVTLPVAGSRSKTTTALLLLETT